MAIPSCLEVLGGAYILFHLKFEEDLANLVSSGLQFSNFRSNFQRKLSQDVKNVKNNECVLVNADKTSSIYQVSKDQYENLLRNNMTKDYKMSPGRLDLGTPDF